jgi:hypothetical protein
MRKTIIIGCSGKKRKGRLPASELYNGPLWQTFRKYDTGTHRIFVLSAKLGLIPADKKITPYDVLLKRDVSIDELAKKVKRQLKKYRLRNVYVVAGKDYATVLEKAGLKKFKFVKGTIGVKRQKLRKLLESK